jgi:hypothetical protein
LLLDDAALSRSFLPAFRARLNVDCRPDFCPRQVVVGGSLFSRCAFWPRPLRRWGVRLGVVPGAQHLEYGAPQIQLGPFLVSGQQRGAEFARSVTPVIAGSLDMCRISVEFVQRKDLG